MPRDLIGLLGDTSRRAGLGYRVRYNLACFYAGIGKFSKAIDELRYAVDGPEIADWAKKDLSLKPLRAGHLKEFKELLGITTQPPRLLGTARAWVMAPVNRMAAFIKKLLYW